jgi:hypothetical protein
MRAVHLVEDQPPDSGHVPGRRRLDRRAARPGQRDHRAPPVVPELLDLYPEIIAAS